MKRNFKNKNRAFTLIEMLIYIGIIGIVISGFVSHSLSVSGASNKNYSVVTVQANARTALQLMSRKIREAEIVIVPVSSATSTSLTLNMPDIIPSITFSVSNGSLFMEQNSVITQITDNQVFVTSLVFSNLGTLGKRDIIKIDLNLKFNVPDGDVQFGYTKSYRTAVSTRI